MKAATAGMTMPNSTEHIIREITALLPGAIQTSQPMALTAKS
jgi:hypothetical protein